MSDSDYNNSDDFSPYSDQSKKLNAYQKFLSQITPSLLRQMKQYLEKNKALIQAFGLKKHKVSLYEDVYALVKLKEKESEILHNKRELETVMKEIMSFTNRQYSTWYDRLNRKLPKLTPEILQFYIKNDRQIIFIGNSKDLNTKDLPLYLKSQYEKKQQDSKNKRGKSPSVISINSQSSDLIFQDENKQKTQKNIYKSSKNQKHYPLPLRKNIVEEIDEILNEPEDTRQKKHTFMTEFENKFDKMEIQQNGDLEKCQNIDFDKFASKAVEIWKTKKQSQKYLQVNQRTTIGSNICYNFKRRQFLFINPEIVQSVFNAIKKQKLLQIIKNNKKTTLEQRPVSKKTNESNQTPKNQVHFNHQQIRTEIGKKRQVPTENMSNLNKNEEIQNKKKMQKNKLPQTNGNDTLFDENQEKAYSGEQSQSSQNSQLLKIEKPIEYLENITKKFDISKFPTQVRTLLSKALQISKQIKTTLDKPKKQTKEKTHQQSIIQISDEEPSVSQQRDNSLKQPETQDKKMIYWFNNDQQTYDIYVSDPYTYGYLMWQEEDDQVLRNANINFEDNLEQIQSIIKNKGSETVIKRIKFLKLNLSRKLSEFLNDQLLD